MPKKTKTNITIIEDVLRPTTIEECVKQAKQHSQKEVELTQEIDELRGQVNTVTRSKNHWLTLLERKQGEQLGSVCS